MNPERLRLAFFAAVALYVATLSGLVTAYIQVSTGQVEVAMFVQGPNVWRTSVPNALRGFVMDAPTGRIFEGATMSFSTGELPIASGSTEGHGYLQLSTNLPENITGEVPLHAVAKHPTFEVYEANTTIKVSNSAPEFVWPKHTTRIVPEKGTRAEVKDNTHEGDLRVEPFSTARELARGLPNVVWFRVVDASGAPVAALVEVLSLDGQTDNPVDTQIVMRTPGIFFLKISPVTGLKIRFRISAEDRTGESTIWFTSVTSQFSLSMSQSFAGPGEKVQGVVSTLMKRGGVLVDTHVFGHWSEAQGYRVEDYQGGIAVNPAQGLNQVVVYESIFGSKNAWDSRYVVGAKSNGQAGCHEAAERVLGWLAQGNAAQFGGWVGHVKPDVGNLSLQACNNLLEAMLQAIPTRYDPPSTFLNTRSKDEEKLRDEIKATQSTILGWIYFALGLGFLILLVFVGQGVAQSKRQRLALLEASLDSDLEVASDDLEGALHTARIVVLLCTIVLFFAGLIMILSLL